jgi:LuxR family transcriptional regulator, maltose regulon positive regulatory protein
MQLTMGERAPSLLDGKLRIPRPGAGTSTLHRRRLTELIEQAGAHRLTLVTAPAGAGKTTACADWAMEAARSRRVAWLTLDRNDIDPARFWRYVRAAISPSAGPDSRSAAWTGVLPGLDGPVVLVLDDVHVLADDGFAPSLEFLVRHAPAPLRLILCGRHVSGLQLAKLRLAGDVAEVSAADLACAATEADAVFAALGIVADQMARGPAARDALLRRTEGWMAGLRLAAPSRPRSGPATADYLRDEILAGQPASVREFLLRTSVAGRLTSEFADWLTGGQDSARILDRLDRENLFTDRVGEGEYRYHPLVRDMLGTELRRELPHEVPDLLRRAAQWHAARDEHRALGLVCLALGAALLRCGQGGEGSPALAERVDGGQRPVAVDGRLAGAVHAVNHGERAVLRGRQPVRAGGLAGGRVGLQPDLQ